MPINQINLPVPIGQLLEQLRVNGFSISPGQYQHVFLITDGVFPTGIPANSTVESLQNLRELLGPVLCKSAVEQDRFKGVFESVMALEALSTLGNGEETKGNAELTHKSFSYLKYVNLVCIFFAFGLIGLLALKYFNYDKSHGDDARNETKVGSGWPSRQIDCSVNFGIQSVVGDSVMFVNRSPGLAKAQLYIWDFGDGSRPLTSTRSVVGHRFKVKIDEQILRRVVLKAVGCKEGALATLISENTYNPSRLGFLRLPERTNYSLQTWLPLLLFVLASLLGGSWWMSRYSRRELLSRQRPTGGPFFLSFPPQEDGIRPSPSLLSWANQLQQREESQRHVLAISSTIRQTVRNGGMPHVVYESIKRRPRYLILIDNRSAYDQQARLHAYMMSVLEERSVEMDVFFFHSDPRYLWNEKFSTGLSLSDLFRLHSGHYLVLVTEGMRLLDYNTGEVAEWAINELSGWKSRALLTPVYPGNWHYLEYALSQFFVLLPATPDGQFLLREYLGQADNSPSFETLLRQFNVLPGTPSRGMFAATARQVTVDQIRLFLNIPSKSADQQLVASQNLFTWACATAVFPTPDWAITLAIGRALEVLFDVDDLVTTTNVMKLTALPWLRQDEVPEPLRSELLKELSPDAETVAREAVIRLLNQLAPGPGSIAYEEQQLRLLEQEYHLQNQSTDRFSKYSSNIDLIKDTEIRKKVRKDSIIENRYKPISLLVLALSPLLLYLLPIQTQIAEAFLPLFRANSTAIDSAAYYNNRAIMLFEKEGRNQITLYDRGIRDLFRAARLRMTFETIYNLNVSRYNKVLLLRNMQPLVDSLENKTDIQQILSPHGTINVLVAPLKLFNGNWKTDSAIIYQYLRRLATGVSDDSLYHFLHEVHQETVDLADSLGIDVPEGVDRETFNLFSEKAKMAFHSPGTLDFDTEPDNVDFSTFKPNESQRDSLVGLETARILLYYGGTKSATGGHLDIVKSSSKKVSTEMPNQRAEVTSRSNKSLRTKEGVLADSFLRKFELEETSPIAEQDTILNKRRLQYLDSSLNVSRATLSSSQQDQQSRPQIQQQEQQQQQRLFESGRLREVLYREVECRYVESSFIVVTEIGKQVIKAGIATKLSNTSDLREITLYCNDNPQVIYSKENGFSHVKIEPVESGVVKVYLYRMR